MRAVLSIVIATAFVTASSQFTRAVNDETSLPSVCTGQFCLLVFPIDILNFVHVIGASRAFPGVDISQIVGVVVGSLFSSVCLLESGVFTRKKPRSGNGVIIRGVCFGIVVGSSADMVYVSVTTYLFSADAQGQRS